MRNRLFWFNRWREESYRDLYRCIYGDERYEQDKGLKREWRFSAEISGMWVSEVERLRPLIKEMEELLRENGLETASMKTTREVLEKYGMGLKKKENSVDTV